MQDPNRGHSAKPPLAGPWVLSCTWRDFFCLYLRPAAWDVLGSVENRQHRGWLSFLWELLSHWGPRLQLHDPKSDIQPSSLPSPPIWLIFTDLLGAHQVGADPRHHLQARSSPPVAGFHSRFPVGESPAVPPGRAPQLLARLPSPSCMPSLLPDTQASYRPVLQPWWTFENPGLNFVMTFEEGAWMWHIN